MFSGSNVERLQFSAEPSTDWRMVACKLALLALGFLKKGAVILGKGENHVPLCQQICTNKTNMVLQISPLWREPETAQS
jgi:hypothetical protein